jgi:outer membrane immunogenic protein
MLAPDYGVNTGVGTFMKRIFLSFALATAVLLPAASALAADLDPPPVDDLRPATYDWTGPYAGLSVSSMSEFGTYDALCAPAACGAVGPFEMSGHRWNFGGYLGWQYQIDQFVAGIEGTWDFGGNIGQNHEPSQLNDLAFDNIATLRTRLGMAFDDTLVYLTGGAAFVDTTFSTDDIGGVSDEDGKWRIGYIIGGGIEHAFTDRISARLEYTYMGLPDTSYSLADGAGATADVDMDFDGIHTVSLGVSYNFGW